MRIRVTPHSVPRSEWSYDLLDGDEQGAFARFAVFDGGATLDATETVAGIDADLLQSLLDKSLVRRTGDRFWMLETIRSFAAERLAERPDAEALAERHARHFLALAVAANLTDGAEGAADIGSVTAEQANLRAALAWASRRGDAELGLAIGHGARGILGDR